MLKEARKREERELGEYMDAQKSASRVIEGQVAGADGLLKDDKVATAADREEAQVEPRIFGSRESLPHSSCVSSSRPAGLLFIRSKCRHGIDEQRSASLTVMP